MSNEFTVTLTVAQLNVISAGLLELPAKVSVPVLQALEKQVNAQVPVPDKPQD